MVTGYFIYGDTILAQHHDVAEPFKKLFAEVKPKQVLEIGTFYGGFTLLIRDLLDEAGLTDCELKSYDVVSDMPRNALFNAIKNGAKIDFVLKNVFTSDYTELLEVDEIVYYIQQQGTTIVLCDGGNKKNEFSILTKFLKKGDIIMAHDYAYNTQYFESNIRNKIWNWLEIQESDIQDVSNQNGLFPFHQDNFGSVVWVCKIKK